MTLRTAPALLAMSALTLAFHPAAAAAPPRAPGFAVAELHDFAACVADRGPKDAAAALALDFRTRDYGKAINKLARDRSRCLFAGRLKFNSLLFAGALAERLTEKGRAPAQIAQLLRYDPATPPIQARDETETMALCTVRQAPEAVVALLATAPASSLEEAAMREMAPTVGACLSSGQTMRLNRPGLRALVALAAYRVVRSKGSGAAGAASIGTEAMRHA